jgi:hypothetical protein
MSCIIASFAALAGVDNAARHPSMTERHIV